MFLYIHDIDQVNEDQQEFRLQVTIGELWADKTLSLVSSNRTDVLADNIVRCMWKPDLTFPNSKDGKIFPVSVPNIRYWVVQGHYVQRLTRYILTVGCRMDFQRYPMDTQTCFFQMELVTTPDHLATVRWVEDYLSELQLAYKIPNIRREEEFSLLEFALLEINTRKTVKKWPTGNYTILWTNFTFQRRLTGSVINTYIPSTLIVALSWLAFWLNCNAVPARVTLGATALLTTTTQTLQSRTNLPRIGYVTALDIWLFFCIFMVFASLVEYGFAYTKNINQVAPETSCVSCQKKLLTSECWSSKTHSLKQEDTVVEAISHKPKLDTSQASRSTTNVQQATTSRCKRPGKSLDELSRALFPSIMAFFALVYWTYFLSTR